MIVTTERLQYLWAVAQTGSFSAAGRKLGVSGAAVQQAIQAFEFDLDTQLFERHSGKKPTLTLLGRQIYLQALELIPKLEGIEKQALAVSAGQESQLRIALHGLTLFPSYCELLVDFQNQFPSVELMLFDSERSALKCDKVRLSEPWVEPVDIMIALGRLRNDHGGHDVVIDRLRWGIVAAAHHPLARIKGELTIADLLNHAQLFPQPGLISTTELIEGLRIGSRLIHYSDFYHLRELLIAGLGYAFYPEQLYRPLVENGVLTALNVDFDDGQMNWAVELSWTDSLGPVGRWLISHITGE